MFSILKCSALLLIFISYYAFYILKLKGNYSFFFTIFISFVSITTYIFGLINNIKIAPILLSIIAILLFIITINDAIKNINRIFNYDFLIYLLITIIWLFISTRNAGLSHWDDFSHWYRIAKVMHFDNSFPTTSEILYPTYFPGSACFICFVTKFIPFSVSNCLFAQGLIIIGATSTLLSIFKNNNVFYKVIIALVCSICICSVNTTFYSLIVDALIGLLSLSAFLLIKNNNNRYNYLFLLILLTYIPLVKASGLLFTILLSIYYVINKKEKIFKTLILMIVPLLLMSLYLIRNSIIYPSIATSNQAISLSRFISVGSSKNLSLILSTIKCYLFCLINVFEYHQTAIIWISLLIIIIINVNTNNKEEIWLSLITYVAYAISLLLVYIFSMDISEANGSNLACFERYIGTLAIFLSGIAFSNVAKHKESLSIFVSLSVIFICLFDFKFLYSHYVHGYTDKMWNNLDNKYDEKYEQSTINYLVIYNSNEYSNDKPDKIQALCSTFFRSEYVFAIPVEDIKHNDISNEGLSYIKSANEIIWLTDEIDLSNINY